MIVMIDALGYEDIYACSASMVVTESLHHCRNESAVFAFEEDVSLLCFFCVGM